MERPADHSDALDEARASGDAFLWIGLHEPTEAEFDHVTSEFGLHPLAVEDALHAHQRPKLERYGDSWFMVLKTVEYVDSEEVIRVGEVMVFVGEHFLVSVRHGSGGSMAQVRKTLEANPAHLAKGPWEVVHTLSDFVVDEYE